MRNFFLALVLFGGVTLTGCSDEKDDTAVACPQDTATDSGGTDTSTSDTSATDTGGTDTGEDTSVPVDTGADTGTSDTSTEG
jgi:hypothetical protein